MNDQTPALARASLSFDGSHVGCLKARPGPATKTAVLGLWYRQSRAGGERARLVRRVACGDMQRGDVADPDGFRHVGACCGSSLVAFASEAGRAGPKGDRPAPVTALEAVVIDPARDGGGVLSGPGPQKTCAIPMKPRPPDFRTG
ncbi:MAG: hypothetical protein P3W94_006225 [Paracoccus sp. (in: a-proteobacteria)]|nr:hypothetical protein [Paracoccus sp. (in: a-proteobacteria)]